MTQVDYKKLYEEQLKESNEKMSQTEYATKEQTKELMKNLLEFADYKQNEINTLRKKMKN